MECASGKNEILGGMKSWEECVTGDYRDRGWSLSLFSWAE